MNKLELSKEEFFSTVDSAINLESSNQKLINLFLGNHNVARYVVGKNEQSEELIRLVNIDGLIDDYETHSNSWHGVPILKTSDVLAESIVVNCSTSISPVAVQNNLEKAGLKNVIAISELLIALNGKISLPWFVKQQREDYQKFKNEWFNLYQSMSDDESKKVFMDVLRYRLNPNPFYMHEYEVRLKDQYLEDFMMYKNEVFVDAGGFDGDTTEEFCRRYPDYKKVFLFEPSVRNMQAAKLRLAKLQNIEFLEVGLSDSVGRLYFNSDAGSASAVSNVGSESIDVTTLDKAVNEPVSFIKMDLEGWEMKALAGCKRHIVEEKPKLAISVYHGASDFRDVPRYILSLNPDYKIYFRHYTQGWSESVMYFI
jgi:FkbM family methyltransferase